MDRTSRRTRTTLAVATAAALSLTAAACGGGSGDGGAKSSSFTYWSMWRADEPQGKAIKAAIDEFTAATGVKVKVQFVGRDVRTSIGPAIAADRAPDL